MSKMFITANQKKTKAEKKAEQRTVHVMSSVEATLSQMHHSNAYAGGYGAHGGTKKARNKRSRQEGKRECKNY